MVLCDFSTNTTEILHDLNEEIKLQKGDQVNIVRPTYEFPESQIYAIIQASAVCQQEIKFRCYLAPLKLAEDTKYFWVDNYDDRRIWLQSDPDIEYTSRDREKYHQCACGM